ncbi:putative porin [Hymenobacter crusticola]|uniref:Porin n=1 Tax=Hymenobacter crusticola TaxID=1770526 RepID=A0A243W908_9BACT|nr:putative porin [Hymenobacter crusticola]OUJ71757.1 hypothetical protein BXP70_20575 [Hymenobacter crusticola]
MPSTFFAPLRLFHVCLRKLACGAQWPSLLLVGVLSLFLLRPTASRAQILDDSTKTLYGPKTTLILREADILRENYKGVMVDTSITDIQQQRYWTHDSTYQQDLGNMGTASRPLLWQFTPQIGARLGRDVFNRYFRDATTIPYYDTRSPYTFIRYIQSSAGEQVFEISYARSLGKNFNVGVAYERIAGNKALDVLRKSGLTEQSNISLFTRYQTEDGRYHLVANLTTGRYVGAEQGGIRRQVQDTTWFNYRRARVWLTNATNRDDRDELHFSHTYQLLGRGLTAFHTFDWRRQTLKYVDPVDTSSFYPAQRYEFTLADDRADYRQFENTVGVLGHSDVVDYRLYARSRNGRLTTRTLFPTRTLGVTITDSLGQATAKRVVNQVFLGGTAAFRYKIFAIETAGEFLPIGTTGNSTLGEYWFRGVARVGPLSGEIASSSYAPTLTQDEFFGAHYSWNHLGSNDERAENRRFDNTTVLQFTGRLNQTIGVHHLEASVAAANIANLVYYDRNSTPQELDQAKQLLIVGARYRFNVGKIFLDNEGTYTAGGDGEGLRIPALVTNSKIYYQGSVFKSAVFGQIGAEVYYQSRFRGYEYNPNAQQFYVQDHFTIRNYAIGDVFLNADIKTVSIFLKIAYVNQGLYRTGYFTTPYYSGLPRRMQFGIKWQFFN